MGFPRQKYWSGLLFPSSGDLLDPGIKPVSPVLQEDSLPTEPAGKPLQGFPTHELQKNSLELREFPLFWESAWGSALRGFPGSAWAGDTGSIPWSGKSPAESSGNPREYSCRQNPMDRRGWRALGVTKSQTRLKWLSTNRQEESQEPAGAWTNFSWGILFEEMEGPWVWVFIKNSPLLAGKTMRKVCSRRRQEGQNQRDVNQPSLLSTDRFASP